MSDRPRQHPNRVFVDASAYFALANERESGHQRVIAVSSSLSRAGRLLVTTNFVLAETHAMLLSKLGRQTALRVLGEVERSHTVLVRASAGDERRARSILVQYDDKDFSLTDAISFAVMERFRIGQAFTLDHHFAQL